MTDKEQVETLVIALKKAYELQEMKDSAYEDTIRVLRQDVVSAHEYLKEANEREENIIKQFDEFKERVYCLMADSGADMSIMGDMLGQPTWGTESDDDQDDDEE